MQRLRQNLDKMNQRLRQAEIQRKNEHEQADGAVASKFEHDEPGNKP